MFALIMTKNFNIKKAPSPIGSYPHSKKVGDLLFLSGIGSRNSSDDNIPETFEDECHSVFKNIRTVIEGSGAKWEDLIDAEIRKGVFLDDCTILAHILWEITFYGYTREAVKEAEDNLKELSDKIESGEEKLIPWEDIKQGRGISIILISGVLPVPKT